MEPEIIDATNVADMFSTFDEVVVIAVRGEDLHMFRSPGLEPEDLLEIFHIAKGGVTNG